MSATVDYDPRFAVEVAWSFVHYPVNISYVVFQRGPGNRIGVIASNSLMFDSINGAMAAMLEYPWRVTVHIINRTSTEPPIDEQAMLEAVGARHCEWPEYALPTKRVMLTQAMLARTWIDTQPRPWAKDGNNAALVDSLNGYRAKETAANEFSPTLEYSWEHWLVGAVEAFAVWEHSEALDWGRAPDYTRADRIARVRT